MKVYLDGGFFRGSGIGRYYETLLDRLLDRPEIASVHTVVPAAKKPAFLAKFPGRPRLSVEFADFSYFTPKEFLRLGGYLRRLETQGVGVFHFPHINIPLYVPRNLIVTVHDLRTFTPHTDLGPLFGAGFELAMRRALRKARVIIANSATVRTELADRFPRSRGKTTTISSFLDRTFLAKESRDRDRMVEGLYILYVGNRMEHKNLRGLLAGFRLLGERIPGIKLVIVGRKTTANDAVDEFKASGGAGSDSVIEYPGVDDAGLMSLYGHASAVALLSQYEGFGLPPLEAMALGTPAVVSDIPVFREIFAGAAFFVDPTDPDGIAGGIERVLTEESIRRGLIEEGARLAKQFDGDSQVRILIDCYRRVADEAL